MVDETQHSNHKLYTVHLFVDDVLSATGQDYSIKKAEQNAAENFFKSRDVNAENSELNVEK
ncbi:MAG: Ribonuclease 3 [Bacteroidetes bacterium ADurb.Bin408]|nr:MAG: Ribonuclease 3 [Bacteroidetes bacterium ADurb.Bin408]